MRRPVPLAALLLTALLAGCADEKPPAATDEPAAFAAPAAGAGWAGTAADQPRMRFGAPAFETTVVHDGAFANPDLCVAAVACDNGQLSFDLAELAPSGAPVELAISVTTEACTDLQLAGEGTSFYRYSNDGQSLSATLLRAADGDLVLTVANCSFVTNAETVGTATPVSVEVRSAVRPDVVPAQVPMLVDLAPGDRLLAMGPDVEELIVVPPAEDPVRDATSLAFNVSADGPAGTYVVMVMGGEGMLHGPNVTLRPARVTWALGEPRPIPSGQDLDWGVTVPGIPIAVGLTVSSPQGSILTTSPQPVFMGSYSVRISQADREILANDYPCPVPLCSANVSGLGWSRSSTGTGLFPEGLGRGEVAFTVSNTQSSGFSAQETIGYIEQP